MLVDAIRAESFRLRRDVSALFWGFLFVPLLALGFGLLTELALKPPIPGMVPGTALDLAQPALRAFAQGAGPMTALFAIVGAAALFGGEYRWESWRLLVPRNSRLALLGAKMAVYASAIAVTLLLIAAAGVITAVLGAGASGYRLVWEQSSGAFVLQAGGLFLIAWAQLLQFGAIAAVAAVATRSTVGAILVPVVLAVAQTVGQSLLGLGGGGEPEAYKLLLLPGHAADLLRTGVVGGTVLDQAPSPATLGVCIAVLAVWIMGGAAAALAIFSRQELSRE
jgi:ABC-2 type transport system permease protein